VQIDWGSIVREINTKKRPHSDYFADQRIAARIADYMYGFSDPAGLSLLSIASGRTDRLYFGLR